MPFINIGGVIYHYGIPGMQWGKRRFQNKDGSLTEAGKRRYAKSIAKYAESESKKVPHNVHDSVSKAIVEDLNANPKVLEKVTPALEKIRQHADKFSKMAETDEEYYDSDAYDEKGLERWRSDHGYSREDMNYEMAAYSSSCEEATKELLGAYGTMKVCTGDFTSANLSDIMQLVPIQLIDLNKEDKGR